MIRDFIFFVFFILIGFALGSRSIYDGIHEQNVVNGSVFRINNEFYQCKDVTKTKQTELLNFQ